MAIVVWVVAAIAYFLFKTRKGTITFYTMGVVAFISLSLSSQYLLDHLAEWDPAQYVQSDYLGSVLSIQTYSDRLAGFSNMTRSTEMWSLFGLTQEQRVSYTRDDATFSHDPISTTLMNVGVVGLLIALSAVTWALVWLHRRLLSMPEGRDRKLALILVSTLLGWMGSEVLGKNVVTTFPTNAFFWLFVGAAGYLVTRSPGALALPSESEEPSTPERLSLQPAWARDVSQDRLSPGSERRALDPGRHLRR
jgi:hypothetical protein